MFALLEEREFMRVSDLAKIFGISEVTVRSDLDHLATSSTVQRVHGGAIVGGGHSQAEQSFEQSAGTSASEKAAIGVAAAELVASGDSLILDVGSTATAVAYALARRNDLIDLVVFTNSLTIATELEPQIPRFTVILTGGTLRPRQHSLVDPYAELVLDRVHVTTAFIGCNGIHPEEGVTNINLPEAAVKGRMVKAAQRVVVVAGGPKLGRISMARFAEIDEVDVLITGQSAPAKLVAQFTEIGLQTIVAG
jgi:DeoR family transcriptional regulator of aga operon